MPDKLNHFFRCVQEIGRGWVFQVGIVTWPLPHTPEMKWKPFRHWKTEPNERRLKDTRNAALADPRFFRVCSECHEINNAGHMFDHAICQGCAERNHHVVF